MSTYLNINKLHEELEQRRIRRRMIYDTVLESVIKRIQYTNGANDKCYLFYPVPGFISGMPIRDRPACIRHIMTCLTDMGFIVRFVQPNYIYVSWRHAKYQPVDPLSMLNLGETVQGGARSAAELGYRLPATGNMTQQQVDTATGSKSKHLMSFADQVRANRNPVQSKMIEFESIDEQFLAGNEHYNPNFKPGSIYNCEQPLPPNEDNTIPSHIMRAHRPFLDPTNPNQPEPSLQSPYRPQSIQPQYQPQIKSVSFSPSTSNRGRSRTLASRQPRDSGGPLSLDDLLSPKSTSANRINSIAPAAPNQIAARTQQQNINAVLGQFDSPSNNNRPPAGNIPYDMIGTLL